MTASSQDKAKEIAFFDRHATAEGYHAFTPGSYPRLIDAFTRLTGLAPGSRVGDLGCGSGAFTQQLRQAGYCATGVDISAKLVAFGRSKYPGLDLIEGDVEMLPFAPESFDGVLLSGLVHHLPDPRRCAAEVFRVLRRGGRFMAFDPNRMNPAMRLYRDRASPFYSPVGVTENERPVLPHELADVFSEAGFSVGTDYLSGLSHRHVASRRMRALLPIYNAVDRVVFSLGIMKPFRPFVLTYGAKP